MIDKLLVSELFLIGVCFLLMIPAVIRQDDEPPLAFYSMIFLAVLFLSTILVKCVLMLISKL